MAPLMKHFRFLFFLRCRTHRTMLRTWPKTQSISEVSGTFSCCSTAAHSQLFLVCLVSLTSAQGRGDTVTHVTPAVVTHCHWLLVLLISCFQISFVNDFDAFSGTLLCECVSRMYVSPISLSMSSIFLFIENQVINVCDRSSKLI